MSLVQRILCAPRALAYCVGGVTWMLAIMTATAVPAAQVSPFVVGDEAPFFSLLALERADLAPVKATVAGHNWAAAKQAWAEHLQKRLQPRWTWSHRDRATLLRLCEERLGGMNKHIRKAGERSQPVD